MGEGATKKTKENNERKLELYQSKRIKKPQVNKQEMTYAEVHNEKKSSEGNCAKIGDDYPLRITCSYEPTK